MRPAAFPSFTRRFCHAALAIAGLALTACGDSTPWREARAIRPAEYEMQALRGLGRHSPIARGDSVWVVTGSMVLHSPDRGRTWSKRLVTGLSSGSLTSGLSAHRVGPQIWAVADCEVARLSDGDARWRTSTLPDCDPGSDPSLFVSPGGEAWAWSSERLYELGPDGSPARILYSSDVDTLMVDQFIASDRVLWLLDAQGRLLTASSADPTVWHRQVRLSEPGMGQFLSASADTLWVTLGAGPGGQALSRVVLGAGGTDPRVVQEERVNGYSPYVPGGGYSWRQEGDTILRRSRTGRWENAFIVGGNSGVSTGDGRTFITVENTRARVFGADGAVLGEFSEGEDDGMCAVRRRGPGWDGFTHTGTVLRADHGFVWKQEYSPSSRFYLGVCSVGSTVWGVGTSDETAVVLRWTGREWRLIRKLGVAQENPWIYAHEHQVWTVSEQSGGRAFLYHSGDDGVRWDSLSLPAGSVRGGPHGSRGRVWMTIRGDDGAASRLVILHGDGVGAPSPKLPDGVTDAWLAGDSIWAVDGRDVWFSADRGRGWQNQSTPVAGALLREVRFLDPWLVVEYEGVGEEDMGTPSISLLGSNSSLPEGTALVAKAESDTLGWWSNESYGISLARLVPRTLYPRLARYRPVHDARGVHLEFEIDTAGTSGVDMDSVGFELAGVDAHHYQRGEYDVFSGACHPVGGNATRWSCAFSPAAAGISAGEEANLRLTLTHGDFEFAYDLEPFIFLPWWRRLPAEVVWTLATYLAILSAAALLWWLAPLRLHRLYWGLHRHASDLPWGSAVANAALKLLLPYFAHHSRVLDRWVEEHADRVRAAFGEMDARLIPPEQFVPLPIAVLAHPTAGTGEMAELHRIAEPSAAAFRPMFEASPALVEVVGPGGSGKTTLALRIAGWGLGAAGGRDRGGPATERLARHRMLPVWVDEETSDLLALATRQLRSWTREEVPDAFVRILLARGRALVVADRFSERTAKTQEYLRTVHGMIGILRMIVTSRERIDFEFPATTHLRTCELALDGVARLVTRRLAVVDAAPEATEAAPAATGEGDDEPGPHPHWTIERQAELTTRITRLFRVHVTGGLDETIPLQPLLVRIAVDEAARLRQRGEAPTALAASVPRLVESYLVALNPEEAENDGLSHDVMLRAAHLAARVELARSFRPRSFSREEARETFLENGMDVDKTPDPLRRLRLNGVLKDEGGGYLRFSFDPIAEYLAADAEVHLRGSDSVRWKELTDAVDAAGASSYRQLLEAFRRLRRHHVPTAVSN